MLKMTVYKNGVLQAGFLTLDDATAQLGWKRRLSAAGFGFFEHDVPNGGFSLMFARKELILV